MAGALLAIDFGTTNTVAALWRLDGRLEVVDFDGARSFPSVIYVDDDDALVVGSAAAALLPGRPERGVRSIKALLGRQVPVVLAGRAFPVAELVAAVLRAVAARAADVAGEPIGPTVLTHPADWNQRQLDQFRDAVGRAGLTALRYLPEPVAAAASCAAVAGRTDGATLLVYDLGGGTLDTAVVRAEQGGLRVLGAPRGERTLGGDLFDEALRTHLGETRLAPGEWQSLCAAADPSWSSAAAAFGDEVRRAKELLAVHPYAPVSAALPTGLRTLRLTRDDADAVLRPFVEESVQVAKRTVDAAGLTVEQLTAVAVTGGAARLPIVAATVARAFAPVPTDLAADPTAAVAIGALHLALDGGAAHAPVMAGSASKPSGRGRSRRLAVVAATAGAVAALVLAAVVGRSVLDGGTGSTAGEPATTTPTAGGGSAGTGTGTGRITGTGTGTVLDVLRSDPQRRFTVLLRCFEQTELTDLLSGPGPITLLAPTDAALLSSGTSCVDVGAAATRSAVGRLLRQHVLPSAVVFDAVTGTEPWAPEAITVGDGEVVDSELAGSPVVFEPDGTVHTGTSSLFALTPAVTDVVATNGVVHILDAALDPPSS